MVEAPNVRFWKFASRLPTVTYSDSSSRDMRPSTIFVATVAKRCWPIGLAGCAAGTKTVCTFDPFSALTMPLRKLRARPTSMSADRFS